MFFKRCLKPIWTSNQVNHCTAQDIAYDFQYNGLVEDLAEGDRVAAAMKGKRLLFHRNHGVILGVENMARVRESLFKVFHFYSIQDNINIAIYCNFNVAYIM